MSEKSSTEDSVKNNIPHEMSRRKFVKLGGGLVVATVLEPSIKSLEPRVNNVNLLSRLNNTFRRRKELRGTEKNGLPSNREDKLLEIETLNNKQKRGYIKKNGANELGQQEEFDVMGQESGVYVNPISIIGDYNSDGQSTPLAAGMMTDLMDSLGFIPEDIILNMPKGMQQPLKDILQRYCPFIGHRSPTAIYLTEKGLGQSDIAGMTVISLGQQNGLISSKDVSNGLNGFDRVILINPNVWDGKQIDLYQSVLSDLVIKTAISDPTNTNVLNPYFKELSKLLSFEIDNSSQFLTSLCKGYMKGIESFSSLNLINRTGRGNPEALSQFELTQLYEFIKEFIFDGVEFKNNGTGSFLPEAPDDGRPALGENLEFLDFYAENGKFPEVNFQDPRIIKFREQYKNKLVLENKKQEIYKKYNILINNAQAITEYNKIGLNLEAAEISLQALETLEAVLEDFSYTGFKSTKTILYFYGEVGSNSSDNREPGEAISQTVYISDSGRSIQVDAIVTLPKWTVQAVTDPLTNDEKINVGTLEKAKQDRFKSLQWIYGAFTHERFHAETMKNGQLEEEFNEQGIFLHDILGISMTQLHNLAGITIDSFGKYHFNPNLKGWDYANTNFFELYASFGETVTDGRDTFFKVYNYFNEWNPQDEITFRAYDYFKNRFFSGKEFETKDFNAIGSAGLNMRPKGSNRVLRGITLLQKMFPDMQ